MAAEFFKNLNHYQEFQSIKQICLFMLLGLNVLSFNISKTVQTLIFFTGLYCFNPVQIESILDLSKNYFGLFRTYWMCPKPVWIYRRTRQKSSALRYHLKNNGHWMPKPAKIFTILSFFELNRHSPPISSSCLQNINNNI